jgi:hypothetical protein
VGCTGENLDQHVLGAPAWPASGGSVLLALRQACEAVVHTLQAYVVAWPSAHAYSQSWVQRGDTRAVLVGHRRRAEQPGGGR